MQHLVLSHNRSPGDIAVMTAVVRDLATSRPGEFCIDVDTPSSTSLWDNNPYITPFRYSPPPTTKYVRLDYGQGLRDQRYEPVHFISYFHRNLSLQLSLPLHLQQPWPDLHLSDHERTRRPIAEPYWVILPGGKSDFATKIWSPTHWRDFVNRMNALGLPCVQLGSTAKNDKIQHMNPTIPGVALNLVGRTSLRDMLQLIYHADGVVCGITAAMHFAAGLHKPCVVIAGGREAWWWYSYVPENKGFGNCLLQTPLRMPHRVLHTIGLLPCCQRHGCWRSKLVTDNPRQLCSQQVVTADGAAPQCLQMITPEMVETAVLSYYADGSIGTQNTRIARMQDGVHGRELSANRVTNAVST